jgi:transcriptional regulator with XRE-family HTH domain
MSRLPLGPLSGNSLGDYLREQRQSARLSLRQLSELAGISNPYLSQIERGLKKPSAEILQQLAKGLEVSSESLYVRAGILDEGHGHHAGTPDTRAVIGADPQLTDRQKAALLDIYDSFVAGTDVTASAVGAGARGASRKKAAPTKAATAKAAAPKKATAKKATSTKPSDRIS